MSFGVLLNILFVPTKNLPFSGFVPANTAGAPSHFTVTFTFDFALPDNISCNDSKKFVTSEMPSAPKLKISSSACSRCRFFGMITEIVTKLGIPIASALVGGFFIFLILKYILESVTGQVDFLHNVITSLDNRVKTMNNDIIRIDTLVSSALGLAPDTERIARADGKIDARKD